MNARATTVPVQHADRFFIGGEWVEPSSDATVDVIDSGTEEVYYSIAAAAPDDMSRAVAAARARVRRRPVGAADARRARRVHHARSAPRSRSAATCSRSCGRASRACSTRRRSTRADRLGCARGLRRAGRHVPVRGGVPADRRRQVRPARARAGRRGRRDHPVERAGGAHLPQDRPRAPRRLHRRAQVGAGGAGRGLRVRRGGRADRPAARACSTSSPPTAKCRSCSCATPASTRSRSRDRPRPAGASRRCAASASPGARSSSAGSRRRSSSTTWISAPRPRRSRKAECGLNGQVCSSLTRVIVTKDRHDELVEALAASFGKTRVGDPFDEESQLGPLVSERQRDRVLGYIAKGVDEGATLATGGGRPDDLDRGYYVEPTVFGNVDNRSAIGSEEIFGPVLAVIKADDEQDAVRHRERHHLRAQRVGVHQRRRPGPRGGAASCAPAPSATTPSAPTSAWRSVGSSSRASVARAARKVCFPSWRPRP